MTPILSIYASFVLIGFSLHLSSRAWGQVVNEQTAEVVNYRLRPGTNCLGIPLQRSAHWRGKIGAMTNSTRCIVDQDPRAAGLILGQLPMEAAYVEITASPFDPTIVGERFEVGILETRGSVGSSGQVRMRAAVWDTRPDLPIALVGCSYAIYPHWTLATVFGAANKALLRRAKSAGSADTLRVPDLNQPHLWETFFVVEDRDTVGWRNAMNRSGPEMGARIVPPGTGFMLLIQGSGPERPLVITGEARRHAFRRPLLTGRNLVALGHPCPQTLSSILANRDYGFQAGSNSANSDEIQFRNHGRWEVLRYTQGSSGSADQPSWQCLTARYGGKLEDLPLLPANQAFWIQKVQPDSDFIIPAPAP